MNEMARDCSGVLSWPPARVGDAADLNMDPTGASI
jgi:hypothetical protein